MGPTSPFLFLFSRLSDNLTKDSMNIKAHIHMLLEVRAAHSIPRLYLQVFRVVT